jgi:hypothetical protein
LVISTRSAGTVRCDVADQAHGGGAAHQLIRVRIPRGRRRQGDHPLGLVRAQKVGHAAPLAGIDAQTEGQTALRQGRGHGVANVATVEHEQIVRGIEYAQRLEQHLSAPEPSAGCRLACSVSSVPGRNKGKRIVVAVQRGRLAGRHAQARRIGCHHPATIPARRFNERACPLQQVLPGQFEQLGRKPLTGLAERLRTDLAKSSWARLKATEEAVEFGLNTRAHARDHDGRQARQGEFALAGESPRSKPYAVGECRVEQKISELGQQRLGVEYLSSYCLFINDLTNDILPVTGMVYKGEWVKLRALSLFRKLVMYFESDDVYEEAYKRAIKFIPKGFRGQIKWAYPGNRPFLRIAHGYLLTLMAARDERKAKALANKLLRWSPEDELGVRLLVNDINLISGDYVSTLPNYLALTGEAPVNWYRAALCALRVSNYVDACTYLRKGIAGNVYVAEGLTGRFPLDEHVSGNNSDLNGPRAASEYLASPTNLWTYEETDFVDWVFNSPDVLRERADLMAISEALVFENDTATRADWGARADAFVKGIDDRVSRKMVRKVTTRAGKEVWPWARARRYPFGEKAPVSPSSTVTRASPCFF